MYGAPRGDIGGKRIACCIIHTGCLPRHPKEGGWEVVACRMPMACTHRWVGISVLPDAMCNVLRHTIPSHMLPMTHHPSLLLPLGPPRRASATSPSTAALTTATCTRACCPQRFGTATSRAGSPCHTTLTLPWAAGRLLLLQEGVKEVWKCGGVCWRLGGRWSLWSCCMGCWGLRRCSAGPPGAGRPGQTTPPSSARCSASSALVSHRRTRTQGVTWGLRL